MNDNSNFLTAHSPQINQLLSALDLGGLHVQSLELKVLPDEFGLLVVELNITELQGDKIVDFFTKHNLVEK